MASNSFIKAVGTVTIFSVFTRLLSFIFKVYLSRAVGAEVIGLYQISLSVFYLFAAVGNSGLPQILSRKIAEDNALEQGKNSQSLVTATLVLGVIFSVTTVVCCLLLNRYLSFLFSDTRALTLFVIMVPAVVSTTIYSIVRAWFWGKKQFAYFSLTETLEEILRIVFTALLISGLFSYLSDEKAIAIAFTLSDVAVAIVLLVLFFVRAGRLKRPRNLRDILVPSIPLTVVRLLSGVGGTLLSLLLPLVLVKTGMEPGDATATFGRITGMANPLLFAPNALIASVAIVLIPEMSEKGALGHHNALNDNLNQAISFSVIISGIFVAVYFALGERLTLFLYNDQESGYYLRYASLAMLPMAVNQLEASTLNSIGLEKVSFVSYLVSTLFSFGTIILGTKALGIYSVALAAVISIIVNIIIATIALKKKTGYTSRYLKTLLPIVCFIAPSAYFAHSLDGIFTRYLGNWSLLISAPFAAIMYGVFCVAFGIVDIRSLYVILPRKKRNKNKLKINNNNCANI